MKFSATFALAVIFLGLVANSSALPAQKRLMYFQRPAQYYAAPQRMMYVQYMHPSPYARSTQAAEALVAGESVATGTYLKDCDHAEAEVSAAGPAVSYEAPATFDIASERGEDVLSEASAHAAQAEAEAYPAAATGAEESVTAFEVPSDVDIVAEENEVPDDDTQVPHDFNLNAANSNGADEAVNAEETPEVPSIDVEAPAEEPAEVPVEASLDAGAANDFPTPAPIAPLAPFAPVPEPVNSYLPAKKKVYVELDQSVEDTGLAVASEEAAEDEEEEENVAPVAPVTRRPARRPAVKKPSKASVATKEEKPLPVGTFFPINFGGTKGGAIAIANAFSTGEGGSATSHAIAYGSPEAASLRGCVSCKKH